MDVSSVQLTVIESFVGVFKISHIKKDGGCTVDLSYQAGCVNACIFIHEISLFSSHVG